MPTDVDGWRLRQQIAAVTQMVSTSYGVVARTTTAAAGTTVPLPAGKFTAPPMVFLTAVSSSTTQATVAEIVSVTKDAVVIRAWRTQPQTVLVLNAAVQPVVLVAADVHVVARPVG